MTSATLTASSTPAPFSARSTFRRDGSSGLKSPHRRVAAGVIVGLHVVVVFGLLQTRDVRDKLAEPAPMVVRIVAQPVREESLPAQIPTPVFKQPIVEPIPTMIVTPVEPTASIGTPQPEALPVQSAPETTPVPSPATPAPVAPIKTIPTSGVQYIEAPVLVYPRASRRAGEAGRVVLRVFIDDAGIPRQVQVQQSSGFARLDEAAVAAIQKARFKPYSDNGQPMAGWALVPLSFDLEK